MPGNTDYLAVPAMLLVILLTPSIACAREAGPPALAPGEVRQILSLRPLIDTAEGIAVDQHGRILVTNRRLENDRRVSEVLEVTRDGTVSVLATLDPGSEDSFVSGAVGLALDSRGDVYVALVSPNAAKHGVWRIRRDGSVQRLAGSKNMYFPNALAFDSFGNLYVTDSIDGSIWRFPRTGHGERWIRHALLAPDPTLGANGITFVPPDHLYVANTDRALIAQIRIRPDGRPMRPELIASGPELLTVDGLAADARGRLYAVIAAAAFFGTAPLVQVDPVTGRITGSGADPSAFDVPTSLAIGEGPRDHKSVFVVNSGFFPEGRPDAAPGVVQIGIGVKAAR